MNAVILESIRQRMESQSDAELLEIWTENDTETWSEETFEAIRLILVQRGVALPPQPAFDPNNRKSTAGPPEEFDRDLFEPPAEPSIQQDTTDAPENIQDAGEDTTTETQEIDWVKLDSFSQPATAHMAAAKLETEGIVSLIQNENVVATDWLYTNAVGGITLMVPREKLSEAHSVLNPAPQPQPVTPAGAASSTGGGCPQCGSYLVRRESLKRRILWLPLAIILSPIILLVIVFFSPSILKSWSRRNWECADCGHSWPAVEPDHGSPVVPKQ